jgi:hypothetical protein
VTVHLYHAAGHAPRLARASAQQLALHLVRHRDRIDVPQRTIECACDTATNSAVDAHQRASPCLVLHVCCTEAWIFASRRAFGGTRCVRCARGERSAYRRFVRVWSKSLTRVSGVVRKPSGSGSVSVPRARGRAPTMGRGMLDLSCNRGVSQLYRSGRACRDGSCPQASCTLWRDGAAPVWQQRLAGRGVV